MPRNNLGPLYCQEKHQAGHQPRDARLSPPARAGKTLYLRQKETASIPSVYEVVVIWPALPGALQVTEKLSSVNSQP